MLKQVLDKIEQDKAWVVQHYRHLHQYPELSLAEKETSLYCHKILAKLGYAMQQGFGYGLWADLIVNESYPTVAIRADMDALPIEEQNTHDYISKNKGAAHMCGHDAHMAIALLTAKTVIENKDLLKQNVRFIFQPSEEQLPGGAKGMIAAGCLVGVDEIYGLHCFPDAPVGEVRIREGTLMGASRPFEITLKGKGCHAATPAKGLSPISAAARIIPVLEALPQQIEAVYQPVLSFTSLHAGNTNNVIPDEIQITGALRAFSDEDMITVQDLIRDVLEELKREGYQYDLQFYQSYDCVVNKTDGFLEVNRAAGQAGLSLKTDIQPEPLVEDFCYYLQQRPGAFLFLGSSRVSTTAQPLHSSRLEIDENTLIAGAQLECALIFNAVIKLQEK